MYLKKYIKYKYKNSHLQLQNGGSNKFTIELDSFNDEIFPKKYTAYDKNIEPDVSWHNVPDDTKDLLLICYDPDAVPFAKEVYIHWLIYNIDPTSLSLSSSPNYKYGYNTANTKNYVGPKPPPGSGIHHYHFKLYALNKVSKNLHNKLKSEYVPYDDLVEMIKPLVIDETEIIKIYTI
jgi:Raf kinase inhibitor-like YbhB/YbcL family protein